MSSRRQLSPLAQQALNRALGAPTPKKPRKAAGSRRFWTAEEEQTLRDRYPTEDTAALAAELGCSVPRLYAKANAMGLNKTEAYMEACLQRCGELRAESGKSTRFQPGKQSWNAGMKGLHFGGRSAETQFKPGQINGRAALLVQPVGAERISKDGIRQRKIRADGPFHKRWKSVHSIMWEEVHGPIPDGHIVVFRAGADRENIVIENLELITRGECMKRNTIHNYPPEVKSVIRLVGKLKRTIAEAERHDSQTH
ncbi:TPA: HNH endonuclease [Pseudomonas aeruginosa]|nr:HNH endonuclease [Pseudomonas aeruginosa]